jgi:hypothetical protein
MSLNTLYVPLTGIQQQLIDKLTDQPLAGGTVSFFKDSQRTVPKDVYALTNSPPDYAYANIGSVLTLSSIGTFNDSLGNNLVPYIYPYVENGLAGAGDIDLYYIVVANSGGQFQFSVAAVPNIPEVAGPEETADQQNFITNGQFLLGQLPAPGTISATTTTIAYGGWQYVRSSNLSTGDKVTFNRFNSPLNGIPSGNPRYACRVACNAPNAGDTSKILQMVFQDVNRFSDPAQQLTLFFSGLNNITGIMQLNVNLYKNFGTSGSTPTTTPIGSFVVNSTGYSNIVFPFSFGSNYTQTLGSNNDDYFAIQISFPPTSTFDVSLTDFVLYLGAVNITAYPFGVDPIEPYAVDASMVTNPTTASLSTVNTALANIYNSVIISPYYTSAVISSPFTFSLGSPGAWQVITGTDISVIPGTYMISYNCSQQISGLQTIEGSVNTIAYSSLYNANPTVVNIISSTFQQNMAVRTTYVGGFFGGGCASCTIILVVAVPTVFKVAGMIDSNNGLQSYNAIEANITAVRLGN